MTRHVAVGWIICLCFSKLQMILNPRVYLICNKFTPLYSWQLNPQWYTCHTNNLSKCKGCNGNIIFPSHALAMSMNWQVHNPNNSFLVACWCGPGFKNRQKKYWGSCWIGYKQTLVFLIKHRKLHCHRYRTHNDVPSYVLSFNCCWWY
jgi:hypothetical protein